MVVTFQFSFAVAVVINQQYGIFGCLCGIGKCDQAENKKAGKRGKNFMHGNRGIYVSTRYRGFLCESIHISIIPASYIRLPEYAYLCLS
jgi:hypothetical protein